MTLGQKQPYTLALATLSSAEVECALPIVEGLVEDRRVNEDEFCSHRIEGEALIGVLLASAVAHKDLELIGTDAEEVAKLVFNGLHNLVVSAARAETEYHPHVLEAA